MDVLRGPALITKISKLLVLQHTYIHVYMILSEERVCVETLYLCLGTGTEKDDRHQWRSLQLLKSHEHGHLAFRIYIK